jgi:hypothetical protein
MTHTGKIARLSREIRDQLNRRLQDGEKGRRLVEWLNALPEVQSVLKAEFDGRSISGQNLSKWKLDGYREWLTQQEILGDTRQLSANARELTDATDGKLADHLATVLAARYASMLMGWNGEATGEFLQKLRPLRALCQDIVELRRGGHSAARLKIEQERLEREREKTEEEVVEYFKRWAGNPKVREVICDKCLSPKEREARLCEIFGLPPDDDVPNQTKSK